jgi:hypothetical protein
MVTMPPSWEGVEVRKVGNFSITGGGPGHLHIHVCGSGCAAFGLWAEAAGAHGTSRARWLDDVLLDHPHRC